MKFVIATQELNYLINKCQNVVPVKPTVPVLANFLIEAKGGELTITATDLVVAVKCSTEAKVLEEGIVALPAKHLAQLIRELTSIHVEISVSEGFIAEIVADSSRFKLRGMSEKGFPSLPDMTGATKYVIPQKVLKEMFYCTSFAVAKEDNRYALTGVNVRVQEGVMTFVGTDGKKLARAKTIASPNSPFSGSFTFPIKAVEEIQKTLGTEGEVEVSFLFDRVSIEANNTVVVVKLLSGDYPDIERIIPEKTEKVITLHREELLTLLKQVSLFLVDTSHSVRFSFSDGELRLSVDSMEVGEGKVSMVVNYHGEPLDIAFNPHFFQEVLKHSKKETVTLGVNDSYNPGVVIDQDDAPTVPFGDCPLFILMPMRLNEV
jgi:DNA polymerase-3 subunit beta